MHRAHGLHRPPGRDRDRHTPAARVAGGIDGDARQTIAEPARTGPRTGRHRRHGSSCRRVRGERQAPAGRARRAARPAAPSRDGRGAAAVQPCRPRRGICAWCSRTSGRFGSRRPRARRRRAFAARRHTGCPCASGWTARPSSVQVASASRAENESVPIAARPTTAFAGGPVAPSSGAAARAATTAAPPSRASAASPSPSRRQGIATGLRAVAAPRPRGPAPAPPSPPQRVRPRARGCRRREPGSRDRRHATRRRRSGRAPSPNPRAPAAAVAPSVSGVTRTACGSRGPPRAGLRRRRARAPGPTGTALRGACAPIRRRE